MTMQTDTPTDAVVQQRVMLDLKFTPNESTEFVADKIIEAIESCGTIDDVSQMWAGPVDHPIGHIPWPRLPSGIEQAVNDQAMAELAAAEAEAEPASMPRSERGDRREGHGNREAAAAETEPKSKRRRGE
jgi:hypothetical protein